MTNLFLVMLLVTTLVPSVPVMGQEPPVTVNDLAEQAADDDTGDEDADAAEDGDDPDGPTGDAAGDGEATADGDGSTDEGEASGDEADTSGDVDGEQPDGEQSGATGESKDDGTAEGDGSTDDGAADQDATNEGESATDGDGEDPAADDQQSGPADSDDADTSTGGDDKADTGTDESGDGKSSGDDGDTLDAPRKEDQASDRADQSGDIDDPTPLQVLPRFECPSNAPGLLSQSTPVTMYGIDLVTGGSDVLAPNFYPDGINGIGFNVLDGYVYGWTQDTNELVRIG